MKKLLGAILLVCACVGLVFAQTKKATTPAAAPGTSVSAAVKQLEHDWTDGAKANDAEKVGAVLASDWMGIGPDGAVETREAYLADIKSGASKLMSFEFGPMDVKVIGTVAIVQGSDTEKSSSKGKDSSGKYAWMDVFAKRDGKWQAVRSQTAMVK
jgi:ketosteroid isomerase-like protein